MKQISKITFSIFSVICCIACQKKLTDTHSKISSSRTQVRIEQIPFDEMSYVATLDMETYFVRANENITPPWNLILVSGSPAPEAIETQQLGTNIFQVESTNLDAQFKTENPTIGTGWSIEPAWNLSSLPLEGHAKGYFYNWLSCRKFDVNYIHRQEVLQIMASYDFQEIPPFGLGVGVFGLKDTSQPTFLKIAHLLQELDAKGLQSEIQCIPIYNTYGSIVIGD